MRNEPFEHVLERRAIAGAVAMIQGWSHPGSPETVAARKEIAQTQIARDIPGDLATDPYYDGHWLSPPVSPATRSTNQLMTRAGRRLTNMPGPVDVETLIRLIRESTARGEPGPLDVAIRIDGQTGVATVECGAHRTHAETLLRALQRMLLAVNDVTPDSPTYREALRVANESFEYVERRRAISELDEERRYSSTD